MPHGHRQSRQKLRAAVAGRSGKRNLIGLDFEELTEALTSLGLEKFRAKQVWSWIYHHGATDFNKMTTLAKPVRDKLAEHFTVARPIDHARSEIRRWHAQMARANAGWAGSRMRPYSRN